MTSDVVFNVYFNSGSNSNTNIYTNGDNITKISINNSDNDYYQTGIIELYKCSQQQIGDKIDIYINNSLEFSGYIARKQIYHKAGTSLYNYQLVGKTYDLWRYRTDSDTYYTGYTSYIASSLIGNFCEGVVKGNTNLTDGYNFIEEVNLSDMSIGDAIIKLIGYDGYKFYIDNIGRLIYYDPTNEESLYIFVDEDSIIDMSPIEEADEDLINDIKVIGGSGYTTKTSIPLPVGKSITQVSSAILKKNLWVAQRFKASDDTLSAIRLFLDRTIEPNSPENDINIEIWDNTTKKLFSDDFDTGMSNWAVTSNVFFEDGYLKLNSAFENITQTQEEAWSNHHYHAQIVKFSNTYTIESAYIYTDNTVASPRTYWIELRDTTGGTLHTPNNVLSSGSVTMASLGSVLNLINLNPKYTVNNTDYYALVAHLGNPPTQEIRSHYKRSDVYGDSYCYKKYSDDGTTWYSNITMDMYFGIRAFGGYAKSGYALSKSFGKNIQRQQVFDKYMKITIEDLTSSNRIFLSGSNSGSKNFEKFTNDEWYNFGFENKFSSQVKIRLSSNGLYTPKVGYIEVYTSDTTGGPENMVFEDLFDDYTYLSGATRNKITTETQLGGYGWTTDDGFLMMSSNKAGPYEYWESLDTSTITDNKSKWVNENLLIDTSNTTYAYANVDGVQTYGLTITFPIYKDIYPGIYSSSYCGHNQDYITLTSVYVSGNWVGRGFIKAWEGNEWVHESSGYGGGAGWIERGISCFNDCSYYNVKKLLLSGEVYKLASYSDSTRWNRLRIMCQNLVEKSGSIQSKAFRTGIPIRYLNIVPSVYRYGDKITYSGSKNSGSTWYKVEPNTWTQLGNGGPSGSVIKMMYNMKPSTLACTNVNRHISTSSLKGKTPILYSNKLYFSITPGGGLPKSGTKIEHSNDIYFDGSDIPYPPSYSSYKPYASPKLKDDLGKDFNTEDYYWLILYHPSTSTQYFKYYYDLNSTYSDGMIAYSWGGPTAPYGIGYRWSSNETLPSTIPKGSLIMNMGWSTDIIRAIATNEESIIKYGRHQKIINDSTITTYEDALVRAEAEVYGMENIPRKGSITIEGLNALGLKTSYRLSSNLTNLGLGGLWEIVSFTHNLDNNGFTTTINYGKQPFDITKKISDLEKVVY